MRPALLLCPVLALAACASSTSSGPPGGSTGGSSSSSSGSSQATGGSSGATHGSTGGSGSTIGGSGGSGSSGSIQTGGGSSSGSSNGSSGGSSGLACQACQTVGDCPNVTNFTCEAATNCCVFFCNSASDCGNASLGDPGDPCTASALGCVCNQGVCRSKPCSANADCGSSGLVCKGGNCQPPDSASAAATIVVEPNPAVLHVGAPQQFTATLLDSAGGAVILAAGAVTWSVSGNGAIGQAGVFTPSAASQSLGDTTVTAIAGGAGGTALCTIYAAPASGVQLTLVDAAAGVPITDAIVEYSNASGAVAGTPVTGGDPLGRYALAAPPAGAVLLNVFEPNYQYVSVDATALPPSNDLVLLLAQNTPTTTVGGSPQGVVGGYTGDFATQPGILDPANGEPASQVGDIHIGIAGTALPQDPLDLSITGIFGPPHDVTIDIGGSHTVALPLGVEYGFGSTYFTCSYDGLGPAGGCGLPPCAGGATTGCLNTQTDPSQANWPDSVFACGQRSAWGLGGSVPFSAVSSQLGSGDQGLSVLLPYFGAGFASGVFFQVPYTLQPPVPADQLDDSCTGAPYPDTTPIPNTAQLNGGVPLSLDTPLGLQTIVTVPPLPSLGLGSAAACQQTVLLLAGAVEPGSGLLPLGLSSATTVDPSGPNPSCEPLDASGNPTGNLSLAVSPEHGGVEGDTYGVVVLSLQPGALGGTSSGVTAMAGLVRTFSSLPYGQSVTFPAGDGDFPPYLQNATYNPNGRVFANDSSNSTGASWERLQFQDDLQREWVAYFAPGTATFVLPTPPAGCVGCTDRTLTSAGALASPQAQQVYATQGEIGLASSLPTYLDFTYGAQAATLFEDVVGFSSVGIACPTGVTGGGC